MPTLPPPLLTLDALLVATALLAFTVTIARAPRVRHTASTTPQTTPTTPAHPDPSPAPPRPQHPPVPPLWYRQEYDTIRRALNEGRTVVARIWVSNLIDDCLLTFGEEHPYTRYAWDLLAEIVRTALADLDRTGSTTEPHGSSDPFGTVLFPKGSPYTVVRDLDQISVYRTSGTVR